MRMTRPVRTADEQDAFTGWRKYLHWRAGELRRIKRAASKRERQEGKTQARSWTE